MFRGARSPCELLRTTFYLTILALLPYWPPTDSFTHSEQTQCYSILGHGKAARSIWQFLLARGTSRSRLIGHRLQSSRARLFRLCHRAPCSLQSSTSYAFPSAPTSNPFLLVKIPFILLGRACTSSTPTFSGAVDPRRPSSFPLCHVSPLFQAGRSVAGSVSPSPCSTRWTTRGIIQILRLSRQEHHSATTSSSFNMSLARLLLGALPERLGSFLARTCLDRSDLLGNFRIPSDCRLLDHNLLKFTELPLVKAVRELAKADTQHDESPRQDGNLALECRLEERFDSHSFSPRVNACRAHSWTWLGNLVAKGRVSDWAPRPLTRSCGTYRHSARGSPTLRQQRRRMLLTFSEQ